MPDDDDHLSRIATLWSVVRRAHDGTPDTVRAAQQALLERYGGAVRRYLLASLRDADAADEVFQEFALRFVRGDFHRADPQQGRFRSFLKTTVYHLIVDYQRRRGKERRQQPLLEHEARDDSSPLSDDDFTQSWRDELLARAWKSLELLEHRTGKPYYSALRIRVEYPDLRSPELAEQLAERLGKPISAGNVRVLIHRAREQFARLLLDAVSDSLETTAPEAIEQELIDLNLFGYCRDYLNKDAGPDAS